MRIARTPWQRLRGLALAPPGEPLLLERCRSVHTFGMRFALDLVWLGRDGEVLRVDRGVPPRRVRSCRGAAAVLEVPARNANEPDGRGVAARLALVHEEVASRAGPEVPR